VTDHHDLEQAGPQTRSHLHVPLAKQLSGNYLSISNMEIFSFQFQIFLPAICHSAAPCQWQRTTTRKITSIGARLSPSRQAVVGGQATQGNVESKLVQQQVSISSTPALLDKDSNSRVLIGPNFVRC
jgi:hypothetical protein